MLETLEMLGVLETVGADLKESEILATLTCTTAAIVSVIGAVSGTVTVGILIDSPAGTKKVAK